MMNQDFEWEELAGLKGLELKSAIDYLQKITNMNLFFYVAGYEVESFDEVATILADEYAKAANEDYEPDDDIIIYIGGSYYSDEVPVVEIEDGKVARWYRSQAWD